MRIAIVAAGACADPEVIPFLIEQMKSPSWPAWLASHSA